MVRCMHRTNIYLDDSQVAALDRLASSEGVARALVVRRFIDEGLGRAREDLGQLLAAIEESFGAEPDLESDPRVPDARSQYLDSLRLS